MRAVTVRGLRIGEGTPKIIVPIVARTREEIFAQTAGLTGLPLHVAEWRADAYADAADTAAVLDLLKRLRSMVSDLPLLFTYRTRAEGGGGDDEIEDYMARNRAVAKSGNADAIDVEIRIGNDAVKDTLRAIHAAGALAVVSSHDFTGTPPQAEIVARLCRMQELGADIPKIAVTPTCPQDVCTLLAASAEMAQNYADRPFIAISMGADGAVSRIAGEVFGSALTFGAAKMLSAPGQLPVAQLAAMLSALHRVR